VVALPGKLAGGFEANAFVGTGYQGGFHERSN
jgi:hypothetical protein